MSYSPDVFTKSQFRLENFHKFLTNQIGLMKNYQIFFISGDFRCNEQPGLTSMHTIFLREHNRIAIELSDINPHWKDERTFHEARKIVGAMLQHITFNEWLPIVLGPRVLEIFELKLLPKGYYTLYNDTVNPTVSNAFGSAAFRFGHSLVKNSLSRCNKDFREVPFFIKLHKELNNPSNLHNFGSVDRILLGLATKMLGRRDEFISEELTNHLFQVNIYHFLNFSNNKYKMGPNTF